MSCAKCEKSQDSGMIAYYRVDRANIGIIGCKEHLLKVFEFMELGGINGKLGLLSDYSDFLHKEGYIDSDYYTEEPTAINRYLESRK